MRPHRHHGPHHHGHRHHGPPHRRGFALWRVTRGVHRVLVGVLVAAALAGGLAGWTLHLLVERGGLGWGLLGLAAVAIVAWPLTWVTSFRLARPLIRLAAVATDLRGGHLARRRDLSGDREALGEVGEVADALGAMADRVAQQLEQQRALLAAVSHELRSPLGRMRVLVELDREGLGEGTAHDRLQAEIDGMDTLVGDLLAGARIDFEALAPAPHDARALGLRALELAEVDAAHLEGPEGLGVHVDPTLTVRALRGLLDNARRYGGAVHALRVVPLDDAVRFEVDDDGPGFAEGEAEAAFQPFWRRPGETAAGTGLGLALVRQIAEAHGGRAGAGARPGGGARVWLELPRGEAPS